MQVTKCIDTLQLAYTCHIMNPDGADYGLFISWNTYCTYGGCHKAQEKVKKEQIMTFFTAFSVPILRMYL